MSNQQGNQEVPQYMKRLYEQIGDKNIRCKQCSAVASSYAQTKVLGYGAGECFVLSCSARGHKPWAFCTTCDKRFVNNNAADHVSSQTHKKQKLHKSNLVAVAKSIVHNQDATLDPPNADSTSGDDQHSDFPTFVMMEGADSASVADMSTGMFMDTMESELLLEEDDKILLPEQDSEELKPGSTEVDIPYPPIDMKGNEWLVGAFQDIPRASLEDVEGAFQGDGLDNMRKFYVAEHATTPGYCGGGLQYMVARTFQNAKGTIDGTRVPTYIESRWHIDSFIQYHSMNKKQRMRQSRITKSLMDEVEKHAGSFLKRTFVPEYKDLSRLYGKTGIHSLYNILPIPPVEDIQGVTFIRPVNIVKYMFANGVPIDNFWVGCNDAGTTSIDVGDGKVHHVQQCKKAMQWAAEILESLSQLPTALCPVTDWWDGFGPNRVKNNRYSVDCQTFTVSAPKDLMNTTSNTFLMAIGLKTSKGWDEVQERLRQDMLVLSGAGGKPFMVYHGKLQKVIPVVFKRFGSLADKMQRPTSTYTVGSGSDLHRCYGSSVRIRTPRCKVKAAKTFLKREKAGEVESNWGWSDAFVEQDTTGAKLASCVLCRQKRLATLGVTLVPEDFDQKEACPHCTNWSFSPDPNNLLGSDVHKDYPKSCAPDCPVDPVKGREIPLERFGAIKGSFEGMIRSTRFTFFNLSRPTGNWNKSVGREYLKSCLVSPKLFDSLHAAAVEAIGKDDEIDYTNPLGIGTFAFPAVWIDTVPLEGFLETTMHLLMGIEESVVELAAKWMTKSKSCASATFRNETQPFLQVLKSFHLSWLQIQQHTGTTGSYKCGSWVGENWMAYIRVSQIVFGWCMRDDQASKQDGVKDLSRVITSFHCLVARLMTHSGIDDDFIEETALFLKEFLSCVRELDVRVRYDKLNKKVKKVTDRKKTEAWWTKSNFMSLINLIATMKELGPLILWWDGGGKGEKFIQEVKPHIQRGIREEVLKYFVQLAMKIYKISQIRYFEQRYRLSTEGGFDEDDDEGIVPLNEVLEAVAAALQEQNIGSDAEESHDEDDDDDDDDGDGSSGSSNDDDSDDHIDEEDDMEDAEEAYFSKAEDEGMKKKSTIYIYRNEAKLDAAIAAKKPIAGVLYLEEDALVFYAVFRKPVKQFGRRKVEFQAEGCHFNGMWYAGIEVSNQTVGVTDSLAEIQTDAKMAGLAIPLWYILGEGDDNAEKCCVITNWWKVRNKSGAFVMPTLDPYTYDGPEDEVDAGVDPRFVI